MIDELERVTYVRRYTLAPEAYDYAGTRTILAEAGWLCDRYRLPEADRVVRLVEIPEDRAEAYQEPRYRSGLYVVYTPTQWRQLVENGWAVARD